MKFCFYLFCAVVFGSAPVTAQDIPPYFLGNHSTGTEFYCTFLSAWPITGASNYVKIYVTSTVETEVLLEIKGHGYRRIQKTKPYDVIEFILPASMAQAYVKTDGEKAPSERIYRGQAVHITAQDPITVYGMTRFQYTSDGFLALPVSALGTEYIVASYADVADNAIQYLPSQAAIVAAFDNTTVSFTLGGNLNTQTVGGLKPNETKAVSLNKGDVFHVSSFGKEADLSGSKIVASKPVGVVSGNFCAYVPLAVAACDHLLEMELPTHTWGKAYAVTRIFGRKKNSYVKIMAKEPNTTVYRNGTVIGVIQDAGGVVGTGFLDMRIADGVASEFMITADKPIGITQFNTGQTDDNVPSDPFQMVLTPTDLYVHSMTFTTPGIGDGSGFASNYVNVVFETTAEGTMPSDLEMGFVHAVTGKIQWEDVRAKFGSFFSSLPIPVDGKRYGVKTIKLPYDGAYSLRCSSPFTAYSYGFSEFDSYGYPAGASLAEIPLIDKKPPVPAYMQDGNGNVANGEVVDKDDPQSSGLAKVFLLGSASTNYAFTAGEIIPGTDKRTDWDLSVIDPMLPAKAVIVCTDRAGNDTTIVLEYSGGAVGVGEQVETHRRFSISPNPVVGTALLRYNLAVAAPVRIALYDQLGREVMVLADEVQTAGGKTLSIETGALSAGLYLCRVAVGGVSSAQQILVVKP